MSAITGDTAACAALVERGDAERFRAIMAAPVATRAVLFPLYAFNLEVARAPWVTQESMIAEMRLQWWRDALEEIATGASIRRHEVVSPLSQVLDPGSARSLDALVAARRWDIYRDPFEDSAALEAYVFDTSARLMQAAARALGAPCDAVMGDLGYAAGLAGFLRAIPALEDNGRVPLVDGRESAVADLARGGLARLAAARQAGWPKGAGPAALMAWQAEPVLRQAAAQPARVKAGALGLSPLRESLRLAWCGVSGRL